MTTKFTRYILLGILLLTSLACKAAQGSWLSAAPTTAVDTPTAFVFARSSATSLPVMVPTITIVQPTPTILSAPPVSPTIEPVPASPTASLTPLPPPLPTALPSKATAGPSADLSAATERQQRVFEELWGVVRDEYLYTDYNGLDWQAVGQEYRGRIAAGMNDADFYALMDEVIRRLGDEHSTYFSPDEAAQRDREFQGDNSYVGIGVMTALIPERQTLTVLLVFPGSPAEAAGVQVHDSLLAVDGQPLVDQSGARQSLLRGPDGTSAQVTVQTPGQAPRQVSITRRAVNAQMPVPRVVLMSPGGKRIGYIFIPTFNEINIDEQVGQALQELTGGGPLDGLILDNRFNGGGASDVLINTISYFVDGPVGYFVERENQIELAVRGQDVGGSQSVPLVTLVGDGTASFGEVFAGSLQDLGRAQVIGEVTDGNVEVLSIFEFSDGSRAWIATSSFRPWNNSDQNWEESGIVPDQVVPSEWDQVTLETDPAILAALALFDSQ